YEFYYNIEFKNKELLSEFIYNSIQLSKEAEDYLLFTRKVKAMNIDLKNDTKKDAKPKMKLVTFKKEMLPENLDLALAKSAFEKAFTLSDLKILIQVFQNKPVKVKEKKKSALIDLLFNHLNNGSEFNEETKKK
ncbi:41963_t:CDS:2, partial [Gigaspora margarita]